MKIDFSQMHCGRDAVLKQMEELIDASAGCGAVIINPDSVFGSGSSMAILLVSRKFLSKGPVEKLSNHEFFVCDEGRQVGIDTPEELKQILSQWGYL
jgi:hypothetical protein